jgi:hypothetical protein
MAARKEPGSQLIQQHYNVHWGGIPRGECSRKLATRTNQTMISGDKAGASTRELQQSKTKSPEERKGKPCRSEELPRAPSAILSLHDDRHRRPRSCEGEAPPRAPSAMLSLHDHWCPKTEASTTQPSLPATKAQLHPKNVGLVRRSGKAGCCSGATEERWKDRATSR